MLEKNILKLLTTKKKTLAVAESATGGLLSHRLTNIPGSSLFFVAGIVSYSNQAKKTILKIPAKTIKACGAVSKEVALLMASNLRKILKTDFSLSITGIAGPSGGSKKKPSGLFYIACSSREKNFCKKFIFKGSRLQIKQKAVNQALTLLKQLLNNYY